MKNIFFMARAYVETLPDEERLAARHSITHEEQQYYSIFGATKALSTLIQGGVYTKQGNETTVVLDTGILNIILREIP